MQPSFIEQVLFEVWDREQDLENIVFVLPSRRAGTFLKNSIASHTRRSIFAPRIYSIEQFIEQIAGLTKATMPEQLFCLYQAHLDISGTEKEPFHEFSKWARVLLADFDEIDRYLIPHQKIFSYLAAITEVNHWYVQKKRTALIENYIKFWEQLEPLYNNYISQLLQKNFGHQGLVYRKAYEQLDHYLEASVELKHVFLGFNALNEAESRIIQEILKHSESNIYWDLDRYFLEEPYHDAGYFIRQHKKKWHYYESRNIQGISDGFLAPKNIEIIGVPKNVSQVKYIGELLSRHADNKTPKLEKTAVVLADESLLNPLLNSLPPQLEHANITMGYPLKNSALTGLFEQFFELSLQGEKRGWYHKIILSFLSLPYIQLLLTDHDGKALAEMESDVRKMNIVYISHQLLKTHIKDAYHLFFRPENTKVQDFLKSCLDIILDLKRELGKSKSNNLELDQLFGFYTIFKQLDDMVREHPYIDDISGLHGLYTELLAQQTIDFEGEPLQGLQIMGMLESRVLDFETVIISSVNEGILPAGKQGNSFIPYDVKRELGLPTYKEKDAVYTYHFYRLLQRAKNVYLLYNTEPDVLLGGEKSRLLHQLLNDRNTAPFVKERLASMELPADRPQPIEIPKSTDIIQSIVELAGHGFSPTSLTQYVRNPLDFYKRSILRLEESAEVDETIAANTFGTIIHNSLETLLKPFVGETLSGEALRSLRPEIKPVVLQYFTSFYAESSIKHGKNSIAFQVLVRTVENFIDAEISACSKSSIKILELEKRLKIPLNIPGLSFPVFLKGTLDRVDEVDGNLRIVDYKTGKVEPSDMNLAQWTDLIEDKRYGKAFQVLAYAYMYTAQKSMPEIDGGVISLKNLSKGYLNFATVEKKGSRNRHQGIDSAKLQLFEAQLFELIREICDPSIPFVEKQE